MKIATLVLRRVPKFLVVAFAKVYSSSGSRKVEEATKIRWPIFRRKGEYAKKIAGRVITHTSQPAVVSKVSNLPCRSRGVALQPLNAIINFNFQFCRNDFVIEHLSPRRPARILLLFLPFTSGSNCKPAVKYRFIATGRCLINRSELETRLQSLHLRSYCLPFLQGLTVSLNENAPPVTVNWFARCGQERDWSCGNI